MVKEMDYNYLTDYLNKIVKIILLNQYYYIGKVLSVKEHSFVILDKTNKRVTLEPSSIILCEEVQNGY